MGKPLEADYLSKPPAMTVSFLGMSSPLFAAYLWGALACALGLFWWRLRGHYRLLAVLDVGLGGLVGGLVGARLEILALQPAIFRDGGFSALWRVMHGGLGWHGAFVGGLLGLWLVARWRKVAWADALPILAPALPIIAWATWAACGALGCASGQALTTLAEHPAWQVSESPDLFGIVAPRYATQRFGQALSLLLVSGIGLQWALRPHHRTPSWVWWSLFCVGMLAIDALRAVGSPLWGNLPANVWLDALLALGCLSAALWENQIKSHLTDATGAAPTQPL
ncbi:MAG: prolipoprotein diacylglyceryl transferase family protein [Phototrophicaceae bacterium]|jgi:prolipoprotein diacylglyceryltransferase